MKLITKTFVVLSVLVVLGGVTSVGAAEAKKKDKAEKLKPYPLDVCVVSGEKFGGDMGEPYVFAYEGREIKLCCRSCEKSFKKEPAKFVRKFDEATKKVKPYPLSVCVVSGEPLGEEPVVLVRQGHEFKFCCKDCVKAFTKDSAKYMSKVKAAGR